MKKSLLLAIFPLAFSFSAPAPAPQDGQPITVAYFYKVKWGHQEEFLELYKRNHYPVLEAQIKSGRLLEVKAYTPRFHGEGRSDWTFLSVLVFKNWQAMNDNSEEEKAIRELYPDQKRFRAEEQRRFQLLEAHWDVPLREAQM